MQTPAQQGRTITHGTRQLPCQITVATVVLRVRMKEETLFAPWKGNFVIVAYISDVFPKIITMHTVFSYAKEPF